jgi:diguanylate cyclase (GGDEF)-like protein
MHLARTAGWIFLIVLLTGAAAAAAPAAMIDELRHADDIKTSDQAAFLAILHRAEADAAHLSANERGWLHYLQAYQLLYRGEYASAGPALRAVIDEATDLTLRFRADISLINLLALAGRYNEAYSRLNELLEMQPRVPDKAARVLGFAVAALLYNQAGQYDLGSDYADLWLANDVDGTAPCKAMYLKLDALFRSGTLAADDAKIGRAISACEGIGEMIYANLIRTFVANILIARGDAAQALALIKREDAAVQASRYARLASEFHSIMARVYLLQGEDALARQYAHSAIDKSIKDEFSKPLLDAYEVLYRVAKRQGNLKDALEYHERYAAADKGYLSDTTARTLAFQMVNQQVLEKKRQIDSLNERNQVLELRQEVASKAAETDRLYVALLIAGLAFIALWAAWTKRSQIRFQKLARRDGLTGILNRQHFIDEAKSALQQAARSARVASLILIDLDNFKLVNDTHGHGAGDAVLCETAAVCRAHLRSIDLFGRIGGEEFAVLLPDCPLPAANARAEELRAAIAGIAGPAPGMDVSASFGVTSTAESGHELREMLIHADSALYRAKHLGRNRVELFAQADFAVPASA